MRFFTPIVAALFLITMASSPARPLPGAGKIDEPLAEVLRTPLSNLLAKLKPTLAISVTEIEEAVSSARMFHMQVPMVRRDTWILRVNSPKFCSIPPVCLTIFAYLEDGILKPSLMIQAEDIFMVPDTSDRYEDEPIVPLYFSARDVQIEVLPLPSGWIVSALSADGLNEMRRKWEEETRSHLPQIPPPRNVAIPGFDEFQLGLEELRRRER